MQTSLIDYVSRLFPFHGLKNKALESIFSEINYSVRDFNKGDVIFSPDAFQKKIGFVISGRCSVEKPRANNEYITLNTLSKYASFGIMSIFSKCEEYPTKIVSLESSSVLFIEGEDMISTVKKYPTVAMNVISFLASRVSFLNQKIETFSKKSTLQRLSNYLLIKFYESGERLCISRTKLASELGVGRASLYRDLDFLAEKKLIELKPKEIVINCPKGLERI